MRAGQHVTPHLDPRPGLPRLLAAARFAPRRARTYATPRDRGTMGPMTAAESAESAESMQAFGSPAMPGGEVLAALSSSNISDVTRANLTQAVTRLRPRA